MGLSLQEQLLKAGLVTEKKAKEVRGQKHKKVKQQQKGGPTATDAADLERIESMRKAQEEKEAKDRELNEKRKEEQRRRELNAQVKQIIDKHRVADLEGDETYNFVDGTTLKRLYVKPEVKQGLSSGRLVPVRFRGKYEVVPVEIAGKIGERDPKFLIREQLAVKTEEPVDDYYAQFEVPDDLMW